MSSSVRERTSRSSSSFVAPLPGARLSVNGPVRPAVVAALLADHVQGAFADADARLAGDAGQLARRDARPGGEGVEPHDAAASRFRRYHRATCSRAQVRHTRATL